MTAARACSGSPSETSAWVCATDSAKVGCHAWLAHPTIAEDLATTVRQVLDYDTDAPSSMDDALLGFTTCPVCESDNVRSTLRVGVIQYYCCRACAFCWRAELLTPKAERPEPE